MLDYSSFANLARTLAGFWADMEAHHPGIDSLALPGDAAEQWRQRVRVITTSEGQVRARKSPLSIFVPIRAFYLDIAQWALTDPSWASHAVPCPVRRADTEGYSKAKRKVAARMHQRIRERLPHLLTLAAHAREHRLGQTALLEAAYAADSSFTHAGRTYRIVPQTHKAGQCAAEPRRRSSSKTSTPDRSTT